MTRINVIGGGLAGTEACYQLLKRGYEVYLYEMRKGNKSTPCHHTDGLAELVCSNSLKSKLRDTASGALKGELEIMDCMLLKAAEKCSVPAGGALAVNRALFSETVEKELRKFNNLNIIGEEIEKIDYTYPVIIATGPLTADKLADEISTLTGEQLHFYDAAAPIIDADSIDYDKAFFAARYDKGDKDYLNCGMNRIQYNEFYNALIDADVAGLKEFDKRDYFEGCMPIEAMAKRGEDTIRYGMMKPKGIVNPVTGEKYYAVVQLRKENTEGSAYNMVGFQTNLTFGEQKRVFRMIPGLENAEFYRYGVMHRNTFINSPAVLNETGRLKGKNIIYFAGQMTGVEGYVESIMSGLTAALNVDREIKGKEIFLPPQTTITGALMRYIASPNTDFQPMNANFGILDEIKMRSKSERKAAYAERAIKDMAEYCTNLNMNEER